MTEQTTIPTKTNEDLAQVTVRIRKDQRDRLAGEQRARGVRLADVLRDNLDLAFAMKGEFSKIVEGEFDSNDPTNAPRLVQSLLFQAEERILAGLDRLAASFEARLSKFTPNDVALSGISADGNAEVGETVSAFISMVAESNDLPKEVWLGAFLEIVPRIDMVGAQQLRDLEQKGKRWLEERGA